MGRTHRVIGYNEQEEEGDQLVCDEPTVVSFSSAAASSSSLSSSSSSSASLFSPAPSSSWVQPQSQQQQSRPLAAQRAPAHLYVPVKAQQYATFQPLELIESLKVCQSVEYQQDGAISSCLMKLSFDVLCTLRRQFFDQPSEWSKTALLCLLPAPPFFLDNKYVCKRCVLLVLHSSLHKLRTAAHTRATLLLMIGSDDAYDAVLGIAADAVVSTSHIVRLLLYYTRTFSLIRLF